MLSLSKKFFESVYKFYLENQSGKNVIFLHFRGKNVTFLHFRGKNVTFLHFRGKNLTFLHFKAEKISKSTIYRIIQCAENRLGLEAGEYQK